MSGFEYEFVTEVPREYTCPICECPMREPVQTKCGHRFCKRCLKKAMERKRECPVDRLSLDERSAKDIYPDVATERTILDSVVKCPNEQNGCEWTGELRGIENHLPSCNFNLVPCANANCDVTIKMKDLEDHVTYNCQWRMVTCGYCSEEHPKCLMQEHVHECGKMPLECPDGCGEKILREMIKTHTDNDCPLTIISCPYVDMGCNTEIPRKELESHLQTTLRLHLDLACKTFRKTTSKLEEKVSTLQLKQAELVQEKTSLKMQVQALKSKNATLGAHMTLQEKHVSELKGEFSKYVWRIAGFNAILKEAKDGLKEEVYSSPFVTGKQGYQLAICLQPDGDKSLKHRYLSVFLRVMKGSFDAILSWPFRCGVTFTLIDQQDDPVKKINVTQSFEAEPPFGRPMSEFSLEMTGIRRFISHKNLNTRRYIVDDTLFVQVEVRPYD